MATAAKRRFSRCLTAYTRSSNQQAYLRNGSLLRLRSACGGCDCPAFLARLHPRFHTPAVAIVLYALTAWLLASSGTFLWIIALSSGAIAVFYIGSCAALIRFRKLRPNADALRVPLGPLLSIAGIAICVAVISGLKRNELLIMCVPALVATTNWLWVKRQQPEFDTRLKASTR